MGKLWLFRNWRGGIPALGVLVPDCLHTTSVGRVGPELEREGKVQLGGPCIE